MKNSLLGSIFLSLAASIWGGMYVVSKYVFEYVPPITLVWLRYIIAFFILYSVFLLYRKKTKVIIAKNDWLLFIWIGFIGYFVSIILQFIGTKLSDAHTGALITSATPAFIVVFAHFLLKERFTIIKIIALILASVGVVVIVGFEPHMGSYFWGSLILIGAAITWALLSVFVKIASTTHSILTITTYAILIALLFTTPIMLWEIQHETIQLLNLNVVMSILYLGIVSTAGAFFLWNKGMELMEASLGSLFFFFQPIVGTFLGWLLLHEQLSWNFYIGGMLILLGVLVEFIFKKDPFLEDHT